MTARVERPTASVCLHRGTSRLISILRGGLVFRVAFLNLRIEMRHSRGVLYGFNQIIYFYNIWVIGHDRLAVIERDVRS